MRLRVWRAAGRGIMARVESIPRGWSTITPSLVVKDAEKALAFYKKAFGIEERMVIRNPEGRFLHAELALGNSVLMLGQSMEGYPDTATNLYVYVTDCDLAFNRALAAGGKAKTAPQDGFWGDRYGKLEDGFGNLWTVATHKEDVPPEEMRRRAIEAMR
jgi:PhnB protein